MESFADTDIPPELAQLIPRGGVADALVQAQWAEEEIEAAGKRHPGQQDLLFHSFTLLVPTLTRMATEFVYRSHCREILERVVRGEDTGRGTAAEVCCLCADISRTVPLTSPAAGLYFRMWAIAFPGRPIAEDRRMHHEALDGSRIDDFENLARARLSVAGRRIGSFECTGKHHGQRVSCRFTNSPS
ncbi:hypothetical protein MXD59_19090 [Frankia sp. Ag45/Mut15]|uniref:Uncharacterized protein n=1 Tax=Frankia umida TaxID=573489 RepID=A0ABT0K223_9ACTN|nr:hypothetical protein [Frankia umida]MCK9877856.1 hypothetical protein [Frankia umida]